MHCFNRALARGAASILLSRSIIHVGPEHYVRRWALPLFAASSPAHAMDVQAGFFMLAILIAIGVAVIGGIVCGARHWLLRSSMAGTFAVALPFMLAPRVISGGASLSEYVASLIGYALIGAIPFAIAFFTFYACADSVMRARKEVKR
jgi:hypothetical protein